MKVGGSGDDSWNIEAEKLGAYSGKEIKDRLQKGVVVSLKNQTTGVTKKIKLEVFSKKAATRDDGEYWEKLAGRVNDVVESFFTDVINNGLLSPLLKGDVDMGELDKSIKALTIDFNIQGDGSLKKAKHEYYDHTRNDAISIEERASIEGAKQEEYQRASQELHKSDDSLDVTTMESSASKLKELVCDKDPFELRLKDKVIELFRPEMGDSALVDLLSNLPISKESLLARLNNAFTKLELSDQDDPVGFLVELAGKHLESPDDLVYAKGLLAEIATRLALFPSADFSEAVNALCTLEDVKDIFSGRLRGILEGSLAGLKEEGGQEYTEVAETISEFKGLADKYNLEELKDFTIDQHLEAFKTLD
ncbi:MAG: hypothetical protein GWP59_06615, partial [Chlamydiales bacterium]|nr:hypothetical protein [Chlamydiales bacterium]